MIMVIGRSYDIDIFVQCKHKNNKIIRVSTQIVISISLKATPNFKFLLYLTSTQWNDWTWNKADIAISAIFLSFSFQNFMSIVNFSNICLFTRSPSFHLGIHLSLVYLFLLSVSLPSTYHVSNSPSFKCQLKHLMSLVLNMIYYYTVIIFFSPWDILVHSWT